MGQLLGIQYVCCCVKHWEGREMTSVVPSEVLGVVEVVFRGPLPDYGMRFFFYLAVGVTRNEIRVLSVVNYQVLPPCLASR